MKSVPAILVFFAALAISHAMAQAKDTPTPPAGPGSCYYSENCTGSAKAVYVSANYCAQIGGLSWKPNAAKVCYKLGL